MVPVSYPKWTHNSSISFFSILYIPYSLGSLWQRMVLILLLSMCKPLDIAKWNWLVWRLFCRIICTQILTEGRGWKSVRWHGFRNVNPLGSVPNFAQWLIIWYLLVWLLYMLTICEYDYQNAHLKNKNFKQWFICSKLCVVPCLLRLNCGVTALFGPMMECASLEIVVFVSVRRMSSLNHSGNLTMDFLQIVWCAKKENPRLPLIKLLTARFSKDGLKLTIRGHLMTRLIIVIYLCLDLFYCTFFVSCLLSFLTIIKLLYCFQMRWLTWIFNWILNDTLAIPVIQQGGYGMLFIKRTVQNVWKCALSHACSALVILVWSTMLSVTNNLHPSCLSYFMTTSMFFN